MATKQETLAEVNFGQRVAEEEGDALASYFVETDSWRRVFAGEVDIVYGSKGAGKSALYWLLTARTDALFDRGIILVPAEKPRGTPAFNELVTDPPVSEPEFVGLWKLYFLSLLTRAFINYGLGGENVIHLREALEKEGLIGEEFSLSTLVRKAQQIVRSIFRPKAIEAEMKIDPHSQLPTGFAGRVVFGEPSQSERDAGAESVDQLLWRANKALEDHPGFNMWIMLDRLDVAFLESSDLEKNALRALFRVYLDMIELSRIKLKIFLRTDIWNRITSEGFREASHITRHLTLRWNRATLLNLVVSRALHNSALIGYYKVEGDDVRSSSDKQETFFYRMFPGQVEVGERKSSSLDWMLSRIRDGTQESAPRELIHFLGSLRTQQMRRYEIGDEDPDGETLFSRAAFKEALPEVSTVRLTQTLYAEHPELRERIEALRGGKATYRISNLEAIWKLGRQEAEVTAGALVSAGFFEERRRSDGDTDYWVPFLYRDGLSLTQGAAD